MKILAAFLSFSFCCLAGEPGQFKDHSFFKHMVGDWTCEGELKGIDGIILKITEQWKGEFLGDNTFQASGNRDIDGRSEEFGWTFIRNPATGSIEATHHDGRNASATDRFEVLVSDDHSKIEMTALGTGPNEKIVVVQEFRKNDHDILHDKVTFTDSSGTAVLSGELVNKRVPKS
jgi:hypothetical protein